MNKGRCLREWYFQREAGSGFHYENPPGILFTRVRSSKSQNGTFEAPMSHWYFDAVTKRDASGQVTSFKRNVYGATNHHLHKPVESFLHMGYDIWYTKVLEAVIPRYRDVYHVAFCNYYDVAFNTLFNIGRRLNMSPDDFKTFENFRLVTGNIFNLQTLLTEPCFKCVVVTVSTKNFKEMLHIKTLSAINRVLTDNGCMIIMAKERETMRKIKHVFNTENVSKMFTRRYVLRGVLEEPSMEQEEGNEVSQTCHRQLEDTEIRNFIRVILKAETGGADVLERPVLIAAYHKHVSNLPNQMLRKPVDTQ